MLKTIIRMTACLAVSAAAFVVIAKMDAHAGARSKSVAPAEDAAEPPAAPKSTAAPKKPKAPPPKLEMASLKMPASTAPAAAAATTATTKTGLDSTLTVPDWKGKRLSVARREARKLGFNVTAVDQDGEAVAVGVASRYRIRQQLTAAGTPIEPGADVEVRVREIVPVEGY